MEARINTAFGVRTPVVARVPRDHGMTLLLMWISLAWFDFPTQS